MIEERLKKQEQTFFLYIKDVLMKKSEREAQLISKIQKLQGQVAELTTKVEDLS